MTHCFTIGRRLHSDKLAKEGRRLAKRLDLRSRFVRVPTKGSAQIGLIVSGIWIPWLRGIRKA